PTKCSSTGGVSRWYATQPSLARLPLHASAMAFAPNHGVEAMSIPSLSVATLGTPRIGPRRELKLALEPFWSRACAEQSLIDTGIRLRAANWAMQKKLGVTVIPSNDFSFYDQVLDTAMMVGAIPDAYGWKGGPVPLATYFAMGRGVDGHAH